MPTPSDSVGADNTKKKKAPKPTTGTKRATISTPTKEQRRSNRSASKSGVPPQSILKNPTSSPLKKKSRGRSADSAVSKSTERSRSKSVPRSNSQQSKRSRSRSQTPAPKPKPKAKPTKTPKPGTYSAAAAEGAKTPTPKKLKALKFRGFIQGVVTCKKSDNLRHDVYRKFGVMLSTFQKIQGAKTCRIANYKDETADPLQNASQMPTEHVMVERYFFFEGTARQWDGRFIPESKTRKITFSFLLLSDVDVEAMVEAVTVDMMDHQITLEYKTCQAISHEFRLHAVRVYNRFNVRSFQEMFQRQIEDIQAEQYLHDEEGFLGTLEAAGFKVPKVTVRKDYPFNGPWRKDEYGTDTRFKQVFYIEYPTQNAEQMEAIVAILKKSGKFRETWGQHASLHFAPPKDEELTSHTTLQKWHSICEAHNSTILSMGMIRLNDVINPDFKVEVNFLKSSKNKGERMSLRDVLHSITVPGESKNVQIIHGIARAPDGGYEAAFADTIPLAKKMAANIASHPAGWISGYLKNKGWKADSIKQLLRKSFTTESIVAADTSTFNRHTGEVTSTAVDATDQELRDIQDSWVDMSLGHGKADTVVDAAITGESAAAFNWEDGASVGTLKSNPDMADSDAEGSVVYSDEEEEVNDESEEEKESYDEEEYDSEAVSDDDGSEEQSSEEVGSKVEHQDDDNLTNVSSENTDDLMEDVDNEDWFPQEDTDDLVLSKPIRKLFPEDPGMVEYLLAMTRMAPAPDYIWDLYDQYNVVLEEEGRLYSLQDEMNSEMDVDSAEYEERCAWLDHQHNENQINLMKAESLLRDALAKFAEDSEKDFSAQQPNPEGPLPTYKGTAPAATGAAAEAPASGEDKDNPHAKGSAEDNSQGAAGHARG